MGINQLKNFAAERIQSAIDSTNSAIGKSYERLGTGLRINHASDDSAGLALATALKTDSRIFTQGVQNISQAISLYSVASSAIEVLSTIVAKQKELATEASSESYTAEQRSALDQEAQSLSEEYVRIVTTTKFNGTTILNGAVSSVAIQTGKSNITFVVPDTPALDTEVAVETTVGDGTFGAITNYATVNASATLGAGWSGDFNGDGNLDIVMPDQTNGKIGVRLGNGDGTFQTAKSYSAPGVTSGLDTDNIYATDFNHDGRDDVIRADNAHSKVWLYLANADGSFATPTSFAVTNPRDIYAADVNGDTHVDILVPTGAGKIGVLLGNGSGSFATQVTYATGASTNLNTYVRAGDVDGDGNMDLVTPTWYSSTVSVMLGNGSGAFATGVTYAVGNGASAVALGDIDNDDDLDIVVSNYNAGTVSVLKGNGNGTFAAKVDYTVGTNPYNLNLGDLNGDGALDIVTADSGGDTISILLNTGTGTFSPRVSIATAADPTQALLGDFNNDSVLDILVDQSGTGQAGIMLGNTDTVITYEGGAISLLTQGSAESAIDTLTEVGNSLTTSQGKVGAAQNRLSHAYNVLQDQRVRSEIGADRILNVDVAQETASLVKNKILLDSSTALLAHANQDPVLILNLLSTKDVLPTKQESKTDQASTSNTNSSTKKPSPIAVNTDF